MRTVELGLYLYAGEWHDSGLLEAAERYRHPFTAMPGRSRDPRSEPSIPEGGIEVGGRGVVLSSYRDTGGQDPELRLVALHPEPTTATIHTVHGEHRVEMRPWQIMTTSTHR
jgi:alpha-mannosidase